MLPKLENAEDAVKALLDAREREFREESAMLAILKTASEDAIAASALIEEANDSAFFDMTISGEDTIAAIDETLTRLVDEDFAQFQAALEIRGEVNLVTGLAIAFGQNRQSQIGSIITDLASSAIDRLNTLVDANTDTLAHNRPLPKLFLR